MARGGYGNVLLLPREILTHGLGIGVKPVPLIDAGVGVLLALARAHPGFADGEEVLVFLGQIGGTAQKQGLALPLEDQLVVLGILIDALPGGVDGEAGGGGAMTAEQNDLWGHAALVADLLPLIEQDEHALAVHIAVGQIQKDEINAQGGEHGGVLAVDPAVGVDVVAEVGLAPDVGLILEHHLPHGEQSPLGEDLGIVDEGARAGFSGIVMADEVEQTHLLALTGVADLLVGGEGTSQGIGGHPGIVDGGAVSRGHGGGHGGGGGQDAGRRQKKDGQGRGCDSFDKLFHAVTSFHARICLMVWLMYFSSSSKAVL